MNILDRRTLLATTAATLMPYASHAQARTFKLLLNTSFSGPVSFLLLADDKGYLRDEGLTVTFAEGDGAAAIVPKVRSGAYDLGYGDLTALIERIAREKPNEGPVAIWTTFNSVPFTIAVDAKSSIRAPKDFEGKTISGHPLDAALVTFDMFAKANGVDASKVTTVQSSAAMGDQVAGMLRKNDVQGVFGFVKTIIASVAPLGIDGSKELRFINYADALPDMYGNGLFVTRETYRDSASSLKSLVRAFNRALADTIQDPGVAIDALAKRSPSARRDVNLTRLVGTLKSEMAHPEGAKIGIGDMDDARLGRLIDLVVTAKKLPRKPAVREVFDRSFLPPENERIRSLAKS